MFEQEVAAPSPVTSARSSPSLGLAEQFSQNSMEERTTEYRSHNDRNNIAPPHQSYQQQQHHPAAPTIYKQLPQSWAYREEGSSSSSRSSYSPVQQQQLSSAPSGTYSAYTQSSYRYGHNVNEQAAAGPANQGHLVSIHL